MELLLLGLILAGLPFLLPIASWVSARRTRARVERLEDALGRQQAQVDSLTAALRDLLRERDASRPAAEPARGRPEPAAAPAVPPPPPAAAPPLPDAAPKAPASSAAPPRAPIGQPPPPVPARVAPPAPPRLARDATPPAPPPPARETAPVAPPPPPPRRPSFDWESLVGVKLFSAIAGIALVLAAVFFLRYSIEAGWLQPPVRVAIGLMVAVALLVACELKAARRYPATANALDAAAIAILFATFFAAHALWDLIPAGVAFGLLALVTALAVVLSIRRESMFIAVLGLLGGFSTPALLSTGENRPIPLFAYLLLLNVGLAWVARQKAWPALAWLTLALTTIYQWGWVLRFLHESSLPLAMAIFLVFPVASLATFAMAGRAVRGGDGAGVQISRANLLSAGLPLLFAAFLASVPEYGARAGLLFGFLLLLDAGLLAIAIARDEPLLHGAGAAATLFTMGIWLGISYPGASARAATLAFTAAFVLLYLFAPAVAARFGRSLADAGRHAQYAASLLLFVFPVLAARETPRASPWPLFGTLWLLVLAIAWRAAAARAGGLYFAAAFFAVAAQAVWSVTRLTLPRLGTAVAIYGAFGAIALAVPLAARRWRRALEPPWGSGVVLLASVALLLFLTSGRVAPHALWALALLLAVLNAALFIESAAGGLPVVAQAGTILSWLVLAHWWSRAAGSVGVLPSLAVLTTLSLLTLAGYAWAVRSSAAEPQRAGFSQGLYLALGGHLFLFFLAMSRAWALPPWPLFGALTVITLATSAASLAVGASRLHAAGTIAAALVIVSWAPAAAGGSWAAVAVLASAAVSAYALAWIVLRVPAVREPYARTAAAVLFVSEAVAILLVGTSADVPFGLLVLAHAANVSVLLALVLRYNWPLVAGGTLVTAWIAVLQWQGPVSTGSGSWSRLLLLSGVFYVLFVAHPFAVSRRRPADREPYAVALAASAMFFFAAHAAFEAGSLSSVVGIIPVFESAVLAVLLRHLLRTEPAGQRDLGRLALVAGGALAFITVAIPLQLREQWITIGWALEGAALAWLYRRIPHRGLLYFALGLLAAVFVRLTLNPDVFYYEPRGSLPVLNWYLYTYLICAGAFFVSARLLSRTDETVGEWPRPSSVLPAAAVVLLFYLLNIEIADYYATGPTLAFRFGVTVSQDLTYTIGWLVFGMALLAAGIYLQNRAARGAAVGLIAITTFKCFLYDLGSLEGLYRVASFVGLAASLALVSLALQKYVLSRTEQNA